MPRNRYRRGNKFFWEQEVTNTNVSEKFDKGFSDISLFKGKNLPKMAIIRSYTEEESTDTDYTAEYVQLMFESKVQRDIFEAFTNKVGGEIAKIPRNESSPIPTDFEIRVSFDMAYHMGDFAAFVAEIDKINENNSALLAQFDKYKVSQNDPEFVAFMRKYEQKIKNASSPEQARQIQNELNELQKALGDAPDLSGCYKRN